MKKFIVSLLGIFMLFGAGLLSACGKTNPKMTLSSDTVAIQLYSEDEDSSYKVITAQLSGVKEGSIKASAVSGYENIIDVSTTRLSSTKYSIRVDGLEEGDAEIIVRGTPGNIVKKIYVNVFSEVSAMSQKEEEQIRKNNFLIRGSENKLIETKLISFEPSDKSRRTITWSLSSEMADIKGLTLSDDSIIVDNEFAGDEVKLVATTEKGVTALIVLPVIDKIENEIALSFSYSQNNYFEEINEQNNEFNIVPNIPEVDEYQGYISIDYSGELDITPYVLTKDGKPTDDIQVLRYGSFDNKPLFTVFASKDKSDINNDYIIGFQIGYTNYNYFVDTIDNKPIKIKAREMVNGITLSTDDMSDVNNTIQTLYTTYVDGKGTSINGQRFDVSITPTTVIDSTNKYSINISRSSLGGAVADGCPIEIWYRDEKNGNIWTQAILEENTENGDYYTSDLNMLSVKTIYLKASSTLKEQIVNGYKITFTSQDNKNVSTSFNLRLVKSATLNDFGFNNANFRVDSSKSQESYSRLLTLKGQTTIDGLSILNNGKYVDFESIKEYSHDDESVTFEVSFTLLSSSYGVTVHDSYQIVHKNGLASNSYDIDIFLPLKDASMYVDMIDEETGEYSSNSIIDSKLSKNVYDINGNLLNGNFNDSLSKLIVKNNKTTPISYIYNQINGISAVANITVGFFDFNPAQMALDEFKNLMNSEDGSVRVVRTALTGGNNSSVAYFTADHDSIVTKGVGHTYAVVAFTGKGVDNVDENGNVTFIRVIYIESLVVPEGMNVYPDANKNITLYSNDTVSDDDKDITHQNITIKFAKDGITYDNISNLEFITNDSLMGNKIESGDGTVVRWQNGRYSLDQISITDEGILFNISAISTFDSHIFIDTLYIHYVIFDDDNNKLYDIFDFVNITIKNAQRVESLKLKNYDSDGLYFEVNDSSVQYLLLETSPTNSKNKNITQILTDENNNINEFLNISDSISADTLSINLSNSIKSGMKGFIYLLPNDAIYGQQIKYYYKDNDEIEQHGYAGINDIPSLYDFLVENAYFKSNVANNQTKNVKFADILVKISVTVADGMSFDYAYRIYDKDSFGKMRADRYYTVMNNLELTDYNSFNSFNGGIQGVDSNVTIKLHGKNFAQSISKNAIVRNITFIGDVNASGFVCDVNNGNIVNVTVDVNGRNASKLIFTGNVGGITGVNSGLIDNSRVLGLTIEGTGYVGGIAGINTGIIKNSKVEFYNLENEVSENKVEYSANTFTGLYVGGIAGKIGSSSSILNSYAYDYTMLKNDRDKTLSVLISQNIDGNSGQVGAFAGAFEDNNFSINNSFAVVNVLEALPLFVASDYPDNINESYISYYNGNDYTSVRFGTEENFVSEGEGFYSYINGGQPHLKNLMQSEFVDNVDYSAQTFMENGYYKSLKVDGANKGILFNYALKNVTELTSSEERDLIALNKISLIDFIGENKNTFNYNIVITSSNSSVVKVVGSDLQILKTGDVVLSLASKHDVSVFKEIKIKVVYALSNLILTWVDSANNVESVLDNSIISLQKTRSRDFVATFENSQVYLGSLASAYQLKQEDNITLDVVANAKVENQQKNVVSIIDTTISGFKVLTNDNSVSTDLIVYPKLFDNKKSDSDKETESQINEFNNAIQNAIKDTFKRKFNILPIEGVISFDISNKSISITPSMKASQRVEIKTTDINDSVYPVISHNGEKLAVENKNGLLYYTLTGQDKPIFKVVVTNIDEKTENETSNLKTYIYDISFEIDAEYRTSVSQEMDFDVFFISKSGNSSEDWGGIFTLNLTRQQFNNIDVSNKKISTPSYQYEGSSVVEVYETGNETSVLAPGNSSILQVNVNPEYAYYDYVELSYSNATVSEAVNIEVMKRYNNLNNKFVRRSLGSGEIDKVGSVLRFYPKADEKGTLYYKLWINSTVNRDSTLKFTARFFDNSGKQIHFVNYYMTISYLAEPTITIDGANTAYLAKGAMSEVKIEVFADQKIDNLTLGGKNIKGVSLSSYGKPVLDPVKGINTYTASIYASPDADAESDVVYISAQVSRDLNGSKEIKEVVSTAILVDFKVDAENIKINGSNERNITIWQGVPKPINFEYNLIPEDYGFASTPEIEEAISQLRQKREIFSGAQYYPAKTEISESGKIYLPFDGNDENDEKELSEYKYFVNYKYDGFGKLHVQNLLDRLCIVNGNDSYSITDESIEKPFKYNFDPLTNSISFIGTKINTSVVLALKTYISAGGFTQDYETLFTVNIDAYSDPDLPLLIKNAAEFKKLDPSKAVESATAHDYILTNDIILENYTPFDTRLINSFDGNGHTIYIKSFNQSFENTSTLKLALFNSITENTILKNVRVNLYNGGQITVDTFRFKEIKIAGLAIENSGIITNCEVVSYYTESSAVGDVDLDNFYYQATDKHNYPEGINVKYTYGANDEPVYLHDNDSWSSEIAGLVISNNGSITNSRVGGDSIIIIGDERSAGDDNPTGETYASNQKLDTFHIIGQGNMAGFVLSNINGNIASSYVKNLDMENQSDSTLYYVSGFVGTNTSTINVSYVEGVLSDPSIEDYSSFAREGSSIKSKKGYIAGFIYRNEGKINDCYSNILIANTNSETSVYLASGFVYENIGTIENGYSASQIENQMSTQMNFSGVNRKGELLTDGEYINCYFFNKYYEDTEENNDNTTESLNNTGAVLVPTPDNESFFYGFAIANSENDGIWKIVKDEGIFLVSTDMVSVSHRYILYIESEGFEGVAGEDDKGKYILPYSTLVFTDSSIKIDTSLGGAFNPIIITDAEDFVNVSGASTSSYIKEYFNSTAMWGTYRIVDNINLSDVANGDNKTILPSSSKAFAGTLYGNGFTISGLSIATEERVVGLGLFRSIERRGRSGQPVVKNLNISLIQVEGTVGTMVGALAGYIKDSVVVSIDINFEEGATLTGFNFAGGLVGFVIGDNTIKGIKVYNPNVTAKAYLGDNITDDNFFISDEVGKGEGSLQNLRTSVENNLNYNTSYSSSFISSLENYSYAGGVLGFVDNYRANLSGFDINQSQNFNIKNIRVNGQVDIEGQVAGGVFGLAGYQTIIRDVGITIAGNSQSHIIATKYFAGGVIGQSFGSLNRVFAVHDDETQDKIENNMSRFYTGDTSAPRGILDLFYLEGKNYTQRCIGGLIGVAYSGSMVISYSKLNVTSPTADYAGGVIGGLKLHNTSSYQINVYEGADYYTKYYLNEVYATGDVRSRKVRPEHEGDLTYAGGIVGQILGEDSRVVMMAVNAFNYITTYDYQEKTYQPLNPGQTNLSQIYRINSLVGQFVKMVDGEKVVDNVKKEEGQTSEPYTKYLTLVKSFDSTENENAEEIIPSVAVYESYYLNNKNQPVSLNLFGSFDAKEYIEKEGLGKQFYFVESPRSYTNSLVGNQYTSTGFLGSGVWKVENWVHDINKLFPTIKYKRTSDILYLDQFNIEEVFRKMQGSNATVYIRGLESKGSEVYGDIRLDQFYNNDPNAIKINAFGGKLVGGKYPQEGEPIKIVSNQNFITSVLPGFKANDVTVQFKNGNAPIIVENSSGESNSYMGLFISSAINTCEISNLKLLIDSPVIFKVDQKYSNSNFVGLVAPQIRNSQISWISISSEINSGYLMSIENANNNIEDLEEKELCAGLIAGKTELTKDGSLENMNVSISNIEIKCDLMSVQAQFNHYNVGSYFGVIQKEIGTPYLLNTKVYEIKSKSTNTDNKQNPTIYIAGNENAEISLGGYYGSIAKDDNSLPINNLQANGDEPITTAINFKVKTAKELNVGGIFGSNYGTNSDGINFNSANATMEATLFVEDKVDYLNAGGVAGLQQGNLGISGYKQIDFGVLGDNSDKTNSKFKTRKNEFDINYGSDINPVVATNAKIGGIVGCSNAPLIINGNGLIINPLNKSVDNMVNNISVDAKEAYLGSVVGYSSASELSITGSIVSNTEFRLNKNDKTTSSKVDPTIGYVGGIVGGIDAGESNIKKNYLIGGNSNNNIIRFDGAVYADVNTLVFGGILGDFNFNNTNTESFLKNTSFGGAVKVYGNSLNGSSVTAGGTIGRVNNNGKSNQDTAKDDATLTGNFNYGDVFVEYSKKSENSSEDLANYNFGGLIAEPSTARYNIHSNYSITTTHNSKYSTISNTANALFGNGIPGNGSTLGQNYYNHAVALANDENGIDVAYLDGNSKSYMGYNFNSINSRKTTILGNKCCISDHSSISKLNPGTINEDGKLTDSTEAQVFNGIKYYTLNGSIHSQIKDKDKDNKEIFDLNNIAIVGDGQNILYNGGKNSDTAISSVSAMIKSLTGYSSVSGIALEVDTTYEISDADKIDMVAPLVEQMYENSIVYAVNARGTLDVGGTSKVVVSGIVGKLYSGKIFDCSTDLDITYRAKNDGTVYGITKTDAGNETDKKLTGRLIENTYSAGSIKTMITSNVYAFTKADDVSTIINNSYTISKLDIHDYTNANDENSGQIAIFGTSGRTTNVYADYDALNYFTAKALINNKEDKATAVKYSTLRDLYDLNRVGKFNNATIKWTSDYAFNYGYPTLKYQYLKTSSYASMEKSQTKLARLKEENRAYEGYEDASDNPANDVNLYDNYIVENDYVRLSNGTTENGNLYYMIPNLAVLSNIADIVDNKGLAGNYILKYDIDVAKRIAEDKEDKTEYTSNSLGEFSGIFDGQDKTIKGLTKTLFSKISGVKTNNTYIKGIVRNLRLTDANLSSSASLLAGPVVNGLISNMTISGDINLSGSYSIVGGLVTTAENTEINTVTNMLNMNVNSEITIWAGGIVGQLKNGSKILFSSNYGPTNVRSKENKTIYLGGLAGEVCVDSNNDNKPEIKYSYNASSVLGNYAASTEVSTSIGYFYTGGIAGKLSCGLIENSYNAGMVKSGNKSNTLKAYAGGIAGIIEGNKSVVNSCYNEGTVEALGKNPTTAWEGIPTELVDDSSNCMKKMEISEDLSKIGGQENLILKQTCDRNVYSYGIGYNTSASGENLSNNSIRLVSGDLLEEGVDNTTIISNGASLGNGGQLYSKSWKDILSSDQLKSLVIDWVVGTYNDYTSILNILPMPIHIVFVFKYIFNLQSVDVHTTAVDWLGIPQAYVLTFKTYHKSQIFRTYPYQAGLDQAQTTVPELVASHMNDGYFYGTAIGEQDRLQDVNVEKEPTVYSTDDYFISTQGLKPQLKKNANLTRAGLVYWGNADENQKNAKTTDKGSYDHTNKPDEIKASFLDAYFGDYTGIKTNSLSYGNEKKKISNSYDNNNSLIYVENKEIKNQCRSQELFVNDPKYSEFININGVRYRFANQNNSNEIFEQGIEIIERDEVVELPYSENINCYSIVSENDDSKVIAKILKVDRSNEPGKVKVRVKYSIHNENIGNGINEGFNITFNDYQEVILDLSNMKYFYYDDYSVGIEIKDLKYSVMKDFKLSYGDGKEVGNVIRISKQMFEYTDETNNDNYISEPIDVDNSNYLYLFCDTDEQGNIIKDRYIFAPNAKLTTPRVVRADVNREFDEEGNIYELSNDNFKSKVKKVITGLFNGKKYYSRSVTSNVTYKACFEGFSGGYSNNKINLTVENGVITNNDNKSGIQVNILGNKLMFTIPKNSASKDFICKISYRDASGNSISNHQLITSNTLIEIDNIVDGSYSFQVEYFATYKTQSISQNEAYEYNLILKDSDNIITFINAVVNPGDFIDDKLVSAVTNINYVARLFGNYIVTVQYQESEGYELTSNAVITQEEIEVLSEDKDGNPIIEKATINAVDGDIEKGYFDKYRYEDFNFYIDNTVVFTQRKKYKGIYSEKDKDYEFESTFTTEYLEFFNEKGEVIQEEYHIYDYKEKQSIESFFIVGKKIDNANEIGDVHFVINADDEQKKEHKTFEKIGIKSFDTLKRMIDLKENKDMFGIYNQDTSEGKVLQYVFIKDSYSVIEKHENYESAVKVDQVEYNEFNTEEYKEETISFKYSNMTYPLNDKFEEMGESFLKDLCFYEENNDENGQSLEIYLKNNYNGKKTFYASVQESKNINDNVVFEYNDNATLNPIILNNDISLIKGNISKHSKLSIIGNGYYISYYDDSLFSIMSESENEQPFINNLNLLGETYGNKTLLIKMNNNSSVSGLTLLNLSMYGSIVNFYGANNPAIVNNERGIIKLINFKQYLAINSIANRMSVSSKLRASEMRLFVSNNDSNAFENKGIIVLANGLDGKVTSDTHISIRTEVARGQNACNLVLGKTNESNNGIIIAGRGGNAMADNYNLYNKDITSDELKEVEGKKIMLLIPHGFDSTTTNANSFFISALAKDGGTRFKQRGSFYSTWENRSFANGTKGALDGLNTVNWGLNLLGARVFLGGESYYLNKYSFGDMSLFLYRRDGFFNAAMSEFGFSVAGSRGEEIRGALTMYLKDNKHKYYSPNYLA